MKTVKLEHTKQGYSYIKCTKEDCFNWGGMAICDNCGEMMYDDVYLIFILGQAFCPKCFEEWKGRAIRYEEDLYLQEQKQERWYMAHGFKTI